MDPQVVAATMYAEDRTAHLLDIQLGAVEPGRATLTMTVRPDMVNGLGVCHGGVLFTLADAAMAYASNGGNERSVATSAAIDFVAPAQVGEVLTAEASERVKPGRSAVNDVTVSTSEGDVVAVFRGRTLTVGGSVA